MAVPAKPGDERAVELIAALGFRRGGSPARSHDAVIRVYDAASNGVLIGKVPGMTPPEEIWPWQTQSPGPTGVHQGTFLPSSSLIFLSYTPCKLRVSHKT